jgi:hypothetical protein
MSWTEPMKDTPTGNIIQFEGDSREFPPYTVNIMRSKVEQEVLDEMNRFLDKHRGDCECPNH